MPKRIFDGEAAWTSPTIGALPEDVKPEYTWMHSVALDDGSFEADVRSIWGRCYSVNRNKTPADVARYLEEFTRARLLFRWVQLGRRALPFTTEMEMPRGGKLWGYWTNIDKPGRLPAPSDRRRKGPGVPQALLRKFLRPEAEAQMRLGQKQSGVEPPRSTAPGA